MWCNDCHVVLCIKYFHLFHTVKNPKQLKAEVMRETKITLTIKTGKAKINKAETAKANRAKKQVVGNTNRRKRKTRS